MFPRCHQGGGGRIQGGELTGKQEPRWGDAGMGNSPACPRVPAGAAPGAAGRAPSPGPACRMCWRSQAPTRTLLLPGATRGSQGGSESREVHGGRGGLGEQGEDVWVLLWGQSLFSGGLVLSFGVSVSAQLLPFNTRDGHRAHKILTWSRTLKAAGLGNCWPF